MPVILKDEPEPRYNYDDYQYDLKLKLQKLHETARENLIKTKIKSKEDYDKNKNELDITINDLVYLRDNTQKNKLSPLWIGPYEVAKVINNDKKR